ncbi:disulfide bond formation protein B [Pseudahrensia aquimaris]|uniref:Disulfide bond formation protein B n=1 Tax=Pseudahrensia aquimaris TaxID=744461 RepID=A0ABW3F931_9HYPH
MTAAPNSQSSLLNTSGPMQTRIALIVLVGMTAVVGSALAFEHIGGYAPCALCLEQRDPYYLGIPLLALGAIGALLKWPACVVRGGLMIAFFCLLATAALGAYHAGIEWGWWPGPASCTAGMTGAVGDSGNLLNSLVNSKPPSCDEAAGRFLGLSFAGWNVVAACGLAVIAAKGAFGKATV